MDGAESFVLEVHQLNIAVGDKPILRDVSFSVKSGEVVAIMGPSGAGKTTLITCLTTPQMPQQYTYNGDIKLNGERLRDFKNSGKLIGYSPQFDNFYPDFTAGDHIWYKAKLKFPSSVTAADREKRIAEVCRELKIEHCLNTKLGGEMDKSMSGGEIKRTMVAGEIVVRPPILILDEPTTGLDSAAASILVQNLEDLAKCEKCIIILSLHQPSSKIYFAFDRVLWLAQGRLISDSTPVQLLESLEKLDLACPTGEVVSNHMMDLLENESHRNKLLDNHSTMVTFGKYDKLSQGKTIKESLDQMAYPNRFQQFVTLTMRHFKLRTMQYTTLSCVLNKLLITAILCAVWFGAWNKGNPVSSATRNHLGYLWFHAQHFAFDTYYASMGNQMTERNVTKNELGTRVYGHLEYSLSRIFAEMFYMGLSFTFCIGTPLLFGQAWDIDAWRWFALFGLGFMHVLVCSALSKMSGHLVRDERSAAIFGDLYLMISSWTSGYYIRTTTLPVTISWSRWIGEIGNFYNAAVITLYSGLDYACEGSMQFICAGADTVSGSELFEAWGLDMPIWYNILFMGLLFLGLEVGSVVAAKYTKVLRIS